MACSEPVVQGRLVDSSGSDRAHNRSGS